MKTDFYSSRDIAVRDFDGDALIDQLRIAFGSPTGSDLSG